MNSWIIKDKIKRGLVSYNIGDEVVCFFRKANGHPRSIKDGVIYTIKSIDFDGHLTVAQHSSDGIGYLQDIKVHKMYMINKSVFRDLKIEYLLK